MARPAEPATPGIGPDAAIPDPTASGSGDDRPDAAAEAPPLSLLFERWLASWRVVGGRWLSIAALEARLAALTITQMLLMAVASGLLLATAWIALFGAIVAGLHALGLAWHFALLLVAAVNLALAIGGLYYINRKSNHLIFNALRALVAEPEQHDADNVAGPAAGNAPATTPDRG